MWQNGAHINLEDCLGDVKCYVWSNVEESSTELLNCCGIYVCPYSQGCEAGHPRLEVGLHCLKELAQILLLESAEVPYVIQIPIRSSPHTTPGYNSDSSSLLCTTSSIAASLKLMACPFWILSMCARKKTPILNSREELDLHTLSLSPSVQAIHQY